MKKIFIISLAVIAFAACSKEETPIVQGAMSVAIDPTITRATDVDFENDDPIGLSIVNSDGAFKTNTPLKFSSEKMAFVATPELLWYDDPSDKSSLTAYYPYQTGTALPTEFSVQADQSTTGYTLSDFVTSKKSDVTPSVSAIGMTFKHKLTKLVVNVDNQTTNAVSAIKVLNSIGTATVDFETNTVAVKEGAATVDVVAKPVTANVKYTAIIVPQTVALKLAITDASGKTQSRRLVAAQLASGGQYSISIVILPNDISVTMSGDIEAWEPGDDLKEDDSVEFEEFDTYFIYDGVKYNTVTLKDGRTWMASNLAYIPKGKKAASDFTVEQGFWYPIIPVNDEAAGKYVAKVSTADADIKANGYLYSFAAAVGVDEITEANSGTFEGARGLCPKGWHIPTLEECNGLAGDSSLYWDATTQKGSPIASLEADGFPCTLTGMRQKNTSTTAGAVSGITYEDHLTMGYFMSSTKSSYTVNETSGAITSKNKAMMLMSSAKFQRVTVADASNLGGIALRCIKDKAAK